MKHAAHVGVVLLALMALVGCPQQPSAGPAKNAIEAQATERGPDTNRPQVNPRPAPRMSTPMPPQVLPAEASSTLAVTIDYACHIDSDCAIKDVGSCCGAKPECVNKDSPADPAGVRAQCAKEHRISSCAIRNLTQCGCEQHHCVPKDKTPVGGWIDDPPAPPVPVR
jgi:hypothetical protein